MKSIALYIALFASLWSMNAQLTSEHHLSTSSISTMINATDYKLYAMDAVNNKCIIYNTDYSVYKSINLYVPNNMYLYDIRFCYTGFV